MCIIPLDEDALRRGAEIDARRRAERDLNPTKGPVHSPVDLSFDLAGISVTGWLGALKIADQFSAVVTLGTLDDFPDPLFPEHPCALRLKFDDLTEAEARHLPGSTVAQVEDIETLFTFAGNTGTTLIHCRAGMSRSPAMAVLLALHRGYSIEETLGALDISRTSPNADILGLGEKVLGLPPGHLIGAVRATFSDGKSPRRSLPSYRPTGDRWYQRWEGDGSSLPR